MIRLMQKGSAQLLFLFIILILLFLGSGIYFFQNNPPKTTRYNTYDNYNNYIIYSNQTLGFQLTYSKDSTVKEDTEEEFNKRGNGDFRKNFKGYVGYEPGKFLGAVAVLNQDNDFNKNPFSVWVFDNPDNLTVDSWFDKYWYYPYVWGVFDYTSKGHIALDQEATVSGKQAKYKVVSYQVGEPKFIYISNNQKMYLLRVIGENGDKVLSTFNFLALDNNGQSETSCKVTGCSSEICSDKDVVSACVYLPEYACYKNATCERQSDGRCDWTKTSKLSQCLEKYQSR